MPKIRNAAPQVTATIDRAALPSLLRFNYIPDPWCIYQGLHKLPPATLLTLRAPTDRPTPRHYWSLRHVITHGTQNPFTGTDTDSYPRTSWRSTSGCEDHPS